MNSEHIVPQLLLRSWPFPRGAGRLTDRFFAGLKFKNHVETVQTTDGFPMKVMPNDLIGRHIYLTGEFDRSIVEVIKTFAAPGDTLLDIGANVGYVSACILTIVPNSKVIAVEPQAEVLNLLRTNLSPFASRAQIYPFALSDHDGEGFFRIPPENSGGGAIDVSGVKVITKSGYSLFIDNAISRLDLVKIDVEGHEETVIASCLPYFAKFKPKIIVFENQNATSFDAIYGMLRSIDYSIYGIGKSLTRLSFNKVHSSRERAHHDYAALRPGITADCSHS